MTVGAIARVVIFNNQRIATQVTVTHGVVTATSQTRAGLGVVRTFYISVDVDGVSADGQYLSGTLTELAEDVKGGQELRSSNLVFVFGDEANQLVFGEGWLDVFRITMDEKVFSSQSDKTQGTGR